MTMRTGRTIDCCNSKLSAVLPGIGALVMMLWLAFPTVAGPAPLAIPPAENPPSFVEKYYKLVDLLFPRKLLGALPNDILLTLRFIPPFENECQIVVSKDPNGAYVVTYYSLPSGSKRIADQFGEIRKKFGIDTEAPRAAERIKAAVRRVDVPARSCPTSCAASLKLASLLTWV